MTEAFASCSSEPILGPVAGYGFFSGGRLGAARDMRIVDENMPGADRVGEYG